MRRKFENQKEKQTQKIQKQIVIAALTVSIFIGGFIVFTQTSLADKLVQAYNNYKAGMATERPAASYGYGFQTSPARIITGSAFARNHIWGWKLSGVDRTASWDASLLNVFPFGTDFNGGVFVAAGDVTGDGIDEISASAATVGSHVLILNKDGSRRPIDFHPFASGGGVNIDMGDVTGNGKYEIACGTNTGIGNVKVYRYNSARDIVSDFKPYGETVTRVKVALGDIDADGADEIIIGAAPVPNGPSVNPHIRVFETDGSPKPINFYAFGPIEDITAGDIDGDGKDEIIVSSGSRIKAYRYNNAQTVMADITAYPPEFGVAARINAYDVDQDGKAEIITGTGDGGGPNIKVWEIFDNQAGMLSSFLAYDLNWRHGVDAAGGKFE
jgi:hypothetical protein